MSQGLKEHLKGFVKSIIQRKIFYLIYSLIEKWILLGWLFKLINFLIISKYNCNPQAVKVIMYTLVFVIWRDVLALILFSVISFEKVKIEIRK